MYVPRFNAMGEDEAALRALVDAVGSVTLTTTGPDGYPVATLMPVIWADDGRLVLHMARANPHWQDIEAVAGEDGDDGGVARGVPALAIALAPEAYVSPSWYASKAEHGRTVPTWNYSAVEFRGRVHVHHDADWLLDAVSRLSDLHEQRRAEPWAVTDAPERFVRGQLRAIVGIELVIETVTGKAKLSQNKHDAAHDGVVAGLRAEGDRRGQDVAEAMARERALHPREA